MAGRADLTREEAIKAARKISEATGINADWKGRLKGPVEGKEVTATPPGLGNHLKNPFTIGGRLG